MTFTSVQSNAGGSGTGSSSTAATLATGVTAGNLVYVLFSGGYGTPVTAPSGWTQVGPTAGYGASGLLHLTCFYTVVTAGQAGQTSWTFSWSGSHTPAWVVREWHSSTGWQATPLDQAQGASSTGSATVSTGTTAATAQASELWVAGLCYDTDFQTESGLSSGWTQGAESAVTGSEALREAYQIATATGAASCQMTIVSSTDWAGLVATFMPAAGGHTATAALTVTPSLSAAPGGGHYSLFSRAPHTDGNVGVNQGTVGVHFTTSTAGTLPAILLNSSSGVSALPATIALYNYSTQALIHSESATWSGAAGSGWISASFTSAPTLAPSTDYMAVVFGPAGSFGYDTSGTAWPIGNGPLTAPADVSTGQGWYNIGSALAFPSSQQAGWNWWVDVLFAPSTGTAHTATAALTETAAGSAARAHGATAAAALTATAASSATAAHHGNNTAAAALTVTAAGSAARAHGATAHAALTAAAASSAAAVRGRHAAAALTATAASSAAAAHGAGHTAAAALAVTATGAAAGVVEIGQLLISIASTAGTDPFGNEHPDGVSIFYGGAYIQLHVNTTVGAPAIEMETGGASEAGRPSFYSFVGNRGLSNEKIISVWGGGASTSDNQNAGVELQSAAADGSEPATGFLMVAGGAVGYWNNDGVQLVGGRQIFGAGWTPIPLDAGWSAIAGYDPPAYRISIENGLVELSGTAQFSGAFTAATNLNSANPIPLTLGNNHYYRSGDSHRAGAQLGANGVITAYPVSGGSTQVAIDGTVSLR